MGLRTIVAREEPPRGRQRQRRGHDLQRAHAQLTLVVRDNLRTFRNSSRERTNFFCLLPERSERLLLRLGRVPTAVLLAMAHAFVGAPPVSAECSSSRRPRRLVSARVALAPPPASPAALEAADIPRGETAGAVLIVDKVSLQAGERDLIVDADWRVMPGQRVGLTGANGAAKSSRGPPATKSRAAVRAHRRSYLRRSRRRRSQREPLRCRTEPSVQSLAPRSSRHLTFLLPGAGKSTLLKCLCGLRKVDGGRLLLGPHVSLGYLEQTAVSGSDRTVWEEARSRMTHLIAAEAALESALKRLEAGEAKAADALASAEAAYASAGGFDADKRIANVLTGLGFKQPDWVRPASAFSGGWQMRLALARLLLGPAGQSAADGGNDGLLLLDEARGRGRVLAVFPPHLEVFPCCHHHLTFP